MKDMKDTAGEKIDDLVRTEFERGLKGEDAIQFQKVEWVDYFHYAEDIFNPENAISSDFFHDRVAEVQFIAKLAGNQKARGIFYHLALISPRGYGKKTLLLTIHLALKRLNIASGFVIDVAKQLDLETGNDYDPKLHNTREFQDSNYVFFENCQYSTHLRQWLEVAATAGKLVITSWRPFHYYLGRVKLNQNSRGYLPSKEIFLHEMKIEDMVALVQKRIHARGPEKSAISSAEIALAAEKSLGNIRTLLYFVKHAHEIAMLGNHPTVTHDDVLRAIDEIGADVETLELSEKEIKLLLYILDQGNAGEEITPTKTAQHFEWDLPLTWRYFKRLVTKRVLTKEGTQKGSQYLLNETYLSLGESFFVKNYLLSHKQVNPGD